MGPFRAAQGRVRLAGFHPEMALFCNLLSLLKLRRDTLRQSAGFLVRRTICTPPRNPLISLTLQKNVSFLIWKLQVPINSFLDGH
jgi:hypothetical protein